MPLKNSHAEYQAQDGFVTVQTVSTDSVPAGPLLYGAYAAVWVILILYVFILARRLTRIERDMKEVSARAARRS